eukprot:18918-Heterococcus_DN1.PRE.1
MAGSQRHRVSQHEDGVDTVRKKSGRAHERFLAYALRRAVDEQRNYAAAGSLRAKLARYHSHSEEDLFGLVADIAVISDEAIAAAVSWSQPQCVNTVIVSTRRVAFEFLQRGRMIFRAQSYDTLAIDMLQQ